MEQQPTVITEQDYEQDYDWDDLSGTEEDHNNQIASRSGDNESRLLFATRDSQSEGMSSEEDMSITDHNVNTNTNNEEEMSATGHNFTANNNNAIRAPYIGNYTNVIDTNRQQQIRTEQDTDTFMAVRNGASPTQTTNCARPIRNSIER